MCRVAAFVRSSNGAPTAETTAFVATQTTVPLRRRRGKQRVGKIQQADLGGERLLRRRDKTKLAIACVTCDRGGQGGQVGNHRRRPVRISRRRERESCRATSRMAASRQLRCWRRKAGDRARARSGRAKPASSTLRRSSFPSVSDVNVMMTANLQGWSTACRSATPCTTGMGAPWATKSASGALTFGRVIVAAPSNDSSKPRWSKSAAALYGTKLLKNACAT